MARIQRSGRIRHLRLERAYPAIVYLTRITLSGQPCHPHGIPYGACTRSPHASRYHQGPDAPTTDNLDIGFAHDVDNQVTVMGDDHPDRLMRLHRASCNVGRFLRLEPRKISRVLFG